MSKITEDKYNDIKELYNNGMNAKDIGKIYGVSNTTILVHLRKMGVDIRSISATTQKYSLNESYFDLIDTGNKAYILGLMYSDGCVYVNKNKYSYKMSISLQEDDVDVLQKIKNEMNYSGKLQYHVTDESRKNVYSLVINNKHIVESLIKHGVVPRKTFEIDFPNWLDDSLVHHFIRGIIDGDGHIDKTQINFTGTKMLCDSFRNYMLEHYNMTSNIRKRTTKNTVDLLETWGVYKYDKKCWFANWLYNDSDIYMDRKYNSCIEFGYLNRQSLMP